MSTHYLLGTGFQRRDEHRQVKATVTGHLSKASAAHCLWPSRLAWACHCPDPAAGPSRLFHVGSRMGSGIKGSSLASLLRVFLSSHIFLCLLSLRAAPLAFPNMTYKRPLAGTVPRTPPALTEDGRQPCSQCDPEEERPGRRLTLYMLHSPGRLWA